MKIVEFYTGKMVRAGAGIFEKLEPEPHKNVPAPQHWKKDKKIEVFEITLF
jgi:hypothetical protein